MMRRKREHEERERQKRIQEQRLVDEQRRAALEADQMANRCRAFQAEEQQRQEEAERQRVREDRSVYSNAMLVVLYIFLPMPRHQKIEFLLDVQMAGLLLTYFISSNTSRTPEMGLLDFSPALFKIIDFFLCDWGSYGIGLRPGFYLFFFLF